MTQMTIKADEERLNQVLDENEALHDQMHMMGIRSREAINYQFRIRETVRQTQKANERKNRRLATQREQLKELRKWAALLEETLRNRQIELPPKWEEYETYFPERPEATK